MDLILWRHADAIDGVPDFERALTPKGVKQAKKMGAWLDRNLPSGCRILSSPAVRAVQTAEELGRKFKLHEGLAPDKPAQEILKAAEWPEARGPVLIVGHQPALGQAAALLLAGSLQPWTIRKANVWWLAYRERGEEAGVYLKHAVSPELLVK